MKTYASTTIAALALAALAFTARTPVAGLTKEDKAKTLEALAKALDDRYVYPEIGKKAANALRESLKAGEYDKIEEGSEFAAAIKAKANSILNDAHFNVSYSEQPLPPEGGEPSPQQIEFQRKEALRVNAMFQKVERLPGNIGYIKFNAFFELEYAKRPAQAAMDFIASTDALIFDLRNGQGGDPETVQFICSYLFPETPVHLNTFVFRDGRREEMWTLKDVPGQRYLNKPVYVLTSKATESAAEEFCYDLQNLKRAIIVGSSTWGGANPPEVVRLHPNFMSLVPSGRAENPITKDNWEGKGIKPDFDVDPAKALVEAQKLIVKDLLSKTTDERTKSMLASVLKQLESTPA